MSYADLKENRDISMRDWWKWYFSPRKFWLDNGLHIGIGFVVLLPVALVAGSAFPWWAGALSSALASIPREVGQWPPRRIPSTFFRRAYWDPFVDVIFFGVGGALASLI